VPIGDIDEDEIAFAEVATGAAAADALDLPPALAGLTRRMLLAKMRALSGPSAGLPPVAGGHAVPPALVAEVRFAEWTQDGKMRAPAFLGLREDKDPRECVREAPAAG